ncbi:cyclin-like protein interacting with PHO85 [Rhodotorula toruloides]
MSGTIVEQAVQATIKPLLVGAFLSCAACGVVICLAHHYFTTFKNDRLVFKLLVALCTMLAVADAACNADWSYNWTVTNYGNIFILKRMVWHLSAYCGMMTSAVAIVQCFFCWRVWVASQRKNFVFPGFILACTLAMWGIGIYLTWFLAISEKLESFVDVRGLVCAWAGATAGIDALITGGMVYYLLVQPRRAAAGNFKSNSRLTEMAIYSVKTNLISAILQICVLALLLGRSGSMDYCYLGLLEAKIYIGSLIATLNARTPSSSPEAFATPVDALPPAFSIHFSSSARDTKRSHRRSGSEKLAKFASLIGLGRSSCARDQRSRSVHVTVEQEVAVEQQEEEHELKSIPSLGDVDLEAESFLSLSHESTTPSRHIANPSGLIEHVDFGISPKRNKLSACTQHSATRSPHSSSSSVSSRTDSSSPSMNSNSSLFEDGSSRGRSRRLTNSSRGGGPRSADGSVGSLATTISTGSPAMEAKELGAGEGKTEHADEEMKDEDAPLRMKEARRRRSGSGAMDISTLSVREEDDEEPEPPDQGSSGGDEERPPGAGGESSGSSERLGVEETNASKTRRASVLSSSSSIVRTTEVSEGQESGRNGRRKAPRTGSFRRGDGAETSASTSSSSTPAAPEAHSQRPSPDESPQQSAVQPNTGPSAHHVDIVSYPSPELLRLLACLLEQIAQANDARNARAAASASATPPKAAGGTSATPAPSAGPSSRRSSLTSQSHVHPMSSARSDGGDSEADWSKGRFDAAPLNTPVTPRYKRRLGGEGGPGILDNALDGELDEDELAEREDEMPLTPGVDLLRETGPGGGVQGFMPSLGGTHAPQPLSRRRGSSFIRNKRTEDGSTPSFSRRSSAAHTSSASSASSASQAALAAASRPPPAPTGATPQPSAGFTSNEQPLSSLLTASAVALSSPNATLCFHARNVPAISIEAYLQRILKYCPTTNEVFLALLVYFDRMARIGLEAQRLGLPKDQQGGADASADVPNPSKLFAIDSYNVHRLVIAGVTVASKFFSDVFYTNSRYAKVGGLPLHELNQLELQFLLLNDFRLKISVDELQRYADQLILYWVGRNGDSNPTAAASAASFASSQPRAHSGPPSGAPSTAIETPPLTRSAVAAAAAQAQAASSTSAPQSATSSPYPAHLAHSSTASGGSDAQSTPTSKPFATGLGSGTTSATTSSSAAFRPSPHRPRSMRSHPSTSSSFSSSTVTPGTPSTTRTLGSSGDSSDDEDDGPVGAGFRSRRQSGSTRVMDKD